MKKQKDILHKAAEALAKTDIPSGPPQELRDAIIAKLSEASGKSEEPMAKSIKIIARINTTRRLIKFAAAAILLIVTGYAIGQLSAPRPPTAQQLCTVLEPAIRQKLFREMAQHLQVNFASSYAQLKDELQEQYRRDLTEFAIQTLAVSSSVTNQRLEELIDAINTAQMQDRRWFTASLKQIEFNRLQDKTQLANGLETLALQTEDQLQRTRQDMVRFLVNTQPSSLIPDMSENPNVSNERIKK